MLFPTKYEKKIELRKCVNPRDYSLRSKWLWGYIFECNVVNAVSIFKKNHKSEMWKSYIKLWNLFFW